MSTGCRIAALVTTYFPISHADVIVTRWIEPRATDPDWGWSDPQSRIVSLYVVETADASRRTTEFYGRDLSQEISRQYGIPIFTSIRDALTLGGDALAVDGVLLIAEHGHFPYNEFGQKLYPRKEYFDEIVSVFRQSGRSVPVFCDKHLSWKGEWAHAMVQASRDMEFPLMAGSSLPCVGVEPAPDLIARGIMEEYVGIFYCGAEVYGFHSLELMQSLIETRRGGEAGIVAITAYQGDEVWQAMDRGVWSRSLFDAALASSRTAKKEGDVRQNIKPNPEFPGFPGLCAFHLEHADGLKSTHVMLHGHLEDFTYALRYQGDPRLRAGCSLITAGGPANHYGHFGTLNRVVQEMFLTGRAPIPIERTLLTTCTIERCTHALKETGVRFETPELRLPYQGLATYAACQLPKIRLAPVA